MTTSTHYNLKLVQGSDIVNPLDIDKPNYEAIDTAMYNNESASVGTATELTTGTVHALTRLKTNQNVFRYRATSRFNVGDTFTVDGNVVTAQYPDGSTLSDGCYIIGSEVLCSLYESQLTFSLVKEYGADDIQYTAGTSVKDELDELSTRVGIKYLDITDTTDANGRITVGTATIESGINQIISAVVIDTHNGVYTEVCKRYSSLDSAVAFIRLYNIDNTPLANTQVTVRVWYADI